MNKTICKRFYSFVPFAVIFLAAACAAAPAAAPTLAPTPTLMPAQLPAVSVNVSPGKQVPAGQAVAVVLDINPYQALDWRWTVSGTSGGRLSSNTGESAVYTAGNPGMDIIVIQANLPGGELLKQTVAITVIQAETSTPQLPPTAELTMTLPPTSTPPQSAVALTSLVDGQTVPCEVIAQGSYPLDFEESIWPVVYVAGRYHPQSDNLDGAAKVNGTWVQTVRFGDCTQPDRDRGKPFQLMIYSADKDANAAFNQYMLTGRSSGTWPGMIELPKGVTLHVRILVTRE